MKTAEDFHARADQQFERARARMSSDRRSIESKAAASGSLHSSTTVLQVIRCFDERTREALDEVCAEVARQIEHRGRRWRSAMEAVAASLEEHIAGSPAVFEQTFKLVGKGDPADRLIAVARGQMEAAAENLRTHLREFRDGWTSPKARGWHERHPIIYAITLLLIGALMALAGRTIFA